MKNILIAAAEITARFPDEKDGKPVKQTIDAGTHITPALAKQFGLDRDTMESLMARGHVVERPAHVVTEGKDSGPSSAELAAERAETAEAALAASEAKVKELTEALETAKKTPAKA